MKIKKLISFTFFLTTILHLTPLSSAFTPADFSEIEEAEQNIEILGYALRISYAPAPWKTQLFGWRIEDAITATKQQIAANPSPKAFQKHIKNFLRTVRDHHVGAVFYSTEMALLPFRLAMCENRFFVSKTYKALSDEKHPLLLEKGDEILSIDGIPIQTQFAQFLEAEYGPSEQLSPTDIQIAVTNFTERKGSALHPMPDNIGSVLLKVRRAETDRTESILVDWLYQEEDVPLKQSYLPVRHSRAFSAILNKNNLLASHAIPNQQFSQWIASKLEYKDKNDKNEDQEAKRIKREQLTKEVEGSFLPPLGDILWQSSYDSYFQAALYLLPSGEKIGFVRLHTFMPFNTVNLLWLAKHKEAKLPWKEFAWLMTKFEQEADALVIDQTENMGGSSFYLRHLVSMLIDRPIQCPTAHMTITLDEIEASVEFLSAIKDNMNEKDAIELISKTFRSLAHRDTLHGYTIDLRLFGQLQSYFSSILECWRNGITYTPPLSILGIDQILPHPTTRYTKPLVILVNELDFSCADLFPAIMQDNQRALIFGSRTAGAGGTVGSYSYPNRIGLHSYSVTTSLVLRNNMEPIENLGVTPDVLYTPSVEDLKNGYQEYAKALITTLRQLKRG